VKPIPFPSHNIEETFHACLSFFSGIIADKPMHNTKVDGWADLGTQVCIKFCHFNKNLF
jgi:hypothetical protein